MAIAAGLVGLPNVGKSSLFNALTKSSVPAENYPFCTVDPHLAITPVPDERLEKLAKIFGSQKLIPTTVQFVDIAGLVKGASKGEGLGNQFLSHVMGVDLILHVLRCFEDPNITHVHNKIDPLDDFETIIAELMLKDLESVEKREEKLEQTKKSGKYKTATSAQIKEWDDEENLLKEIKAALEAGDVEKVQVLYNDGKKRGIQSIPLLSGKNFLVIANVSEDEFANQGYLSNKNYQAVVSKFGAEKVIAVSAKIEYELAQLPANESLEMMESLGITESGLHNIIKQTYAALNLITFFTCGPKEAHAWSIKKGCTIQKAAGEIHSDLERGFICSEVYNCKDIFEFGSEQKIKLAGKLRTEGREYIVQDGDLVNIRFNV